MNYYKFIENNDWEGETWNFYLPVDGNEAEIVKLRNMVDDEAASGAFSISVDEFTEEEVDTLVKHSRGGYMKSHNKLSGKLEVPNCDTVQLEDALYKGGIKELMHGN